GRFGIIEAFPPDEAATIAIKNGRYHHQDKTLNVNCLAIHDDWILAVMADYHVAGGLEYGARLCKTIAEQVLWRTSSSIEGRYDARHRSGIEVVRAAPDGRTSSA